MLEQHSKKPGQYPEEGRRMSDVAYAQSLMREAFPKEKYGGYKQAVYAAYRYMMPKANKRITERRARAIWDGEARRIDLEEADILRRAAIEEARREQNELRARLAALDAKLATADAFLAGRKVAATGIGADRMG